MSNPTDFELLTAIISRGCVAFADLEHIFPGSDVDTALETAGRLRDDGRIETFWREGVDPHNLERPSPGHPRLFRRPADSEAHPARLRAHTNGEG
jgi:hypothetical protein